MGLQLLSVLLILHQAQALPDGMPDSFPDSHLAMGAAAGRRSLTQAGPFLCPGAGFFNGTACSRLYYKCNKKGDLIMSKLSHVYCPKGQSWNPQLAGCYANRLDPACPFKCTAPGGFNTTACASWYNTCKSKGAKRAVATCKTGQGFNPKTKKCAAWATDRSCPLLCPRVGRVNTTACATSYYQCNAKGQPGTLVACPKGTTFTPRAQVCTEDLACLSGKSVVCPAPLNATCSSCKAFGTTKPIVTCLACKAGFYSLPSLPIANQTCNSTCPQTCTGGCAYSSDYNGVKCADGCTPGWYNGPLQQCERGCAPECATCAEKGSCTACQPGRASTSTPKQCDVQCTPYCATCASSTSCAACLPSTDVASYSQSGGRCTRTCLPGFYSDLGQSENCLRCPEGCATCLDQFVCLSCTTGYFYDSEARACRDCGVNCLACSDEKNCQLCRPGTYADRTVEGGCRGCNSNLDCATCRNDESCLSCQRSPVDSTVSPACRAACTGSSEACAGD